MLLKQSTLTLFNNEYCIIIFNLKPESTRGSRENVNIFGKYGMTSGIKEMFSHLALGTPISSVCSLGSGSHLSGLILGIKTELRTPSLLHFQKPFYCHNLTVRFPH